MRPLFRVCLLAATCGCSSLASRAASSPAAERPAPVAKLSEGSRALLTIRSWGEMAITGSAGAQGLSEEVEASIEKLSRMLRDDDGVETRMEAARTLSKVASETADDGGGAVATLCLSKLSNDGVLASTVDDEVIHRTLAVIGNLAVETTSADLAQRCISTLADIGRDHASGKVRTHTAFVLVAVVLRSASRRGLALAPIVVGVLSQRWLVRPSPDARRAGVAALAQLGVGLSARRGRQTERNVARCVTAVSARALEDPDDEVRREAVGGLAALALTLPAEHTLSCVKAIAAASRDRDYDWRRFAAERLADVAAVASRRGRPDLAGSTRAALDELGEAGGSPPLAHSQPDEAMLVRLARENAAALLRHA